MDFFIFFVNRIVFPRSKAQKNSLPDTPKGVRQAVWCGPCLLYTSHVAVGDGYPQALGSNGRGGGIDNDPIFHLAPYLQGLLLALFLLAADVGNDVVEDVGEGLKRLACAGDGLIEMCIRDRA